MRSLMENKSFHCLVRMGLSLCLVGCPGVATGGFFSLRGEADSQLEQGAVKETLLVQLDSNSSNSDKLKSLNGNEEPKSIFVNFNNISIIEYLRFISKNTNKNFIFDENDLQFNVTLISEEPTSIENVMTALLQELRIHDLTLLEQGNNLIIHKNPKVNAISQFVDGDIGGHATSEIVTQVFRLNTADAEKVAQIIKPLTSEFALVESLKETNHLIITDLNSNVMQIANLIKSLDSPASGLVIGQYVVRTSSTDQLIPMAQKVVAPIAQEQTFIMVPWGNANSIFIVSTPYLVERALSILQYLDQNQKTTQIIDFKEWKYEEPKPADLPPPGLYINDIPYQMTKEQIEIEQQRLRETEKAAKERKEVQPGGWRRAPNGEWRFYTPEEEGETKVIPPKGVWKVDKQGKWHFSPAEGEGFPGGFPGEAPGLPPEGTRKQLEKGQWLEEEEFQRQRGAGRPLEQPKGLWKLDPEDRWFYELEKGESVLVEKLTRRAPPSANIPLGSREKRSFSIYKLQYRKGDSIQASLQAIADSLQFMEGGSEALIGTLNSVQWLETSNSLIFTGFREDLLKMRQLMTEVDVPLRQVFIEMLILDASVFDALQYGVTWGSRFGGGNWAGLEEFNALTPGIPSPLDLALNTTGQQVGGLQPAVLSIPGFAYGIIGQSIINTATGVEFNSIGALFQAVRTKSSLNVILNPKIITEDSVPAEIFVGENIAFKTQSIASGDLNNTITNNFEYRDVGTRLRVTPFLGNNDIVTLEIAQEISAISATQLAASTGANANNSPGPNTTKSTTTTRVHLPDGYFLIISGMMRDEVDRDATQIPCLGAIPVVGPFFGKNKLYQDRKRNQMIFIRPKIVQTEEEIQNITKHNQDIWKYKHEFKQDWLYETEEALEFLNLRENDVEDVDPEFARYNY